MNSTDIKLSTEFALLLKAKNRKNINKWKNKNWLVNEDREASDIETIEHLLDPSTLKNYIKYISEDPFNHECIFINSKSKNQFIKDFS